MLVLSLVLIGLAITLDPIPLTAFILVLVSRSGVRKGAAFIFGWLVSLAIVIAFTVFVTGNNPPKPSTAPSLAALAAKLAIGLWLLVVAVRQYRKLGKPKPPKKPPRWQAGIDHMTPWYAIGLSPLTQPWGLIAAGVTVIVEAKLSSWQDYLALALFCVIATSSILAMEIYAGFRPQPAQEFLARLRQWIDTHTDQVIIIVSLLLGFWLVANSIYYLVT
jgi:threonine/homoserine/homoserine lactone efflux protein